MPRYFGIILFRKARTKDKLLELVRRAAEFSGIELEACAMMGDISEFMKTAKELFAIWYNREFGYSGSVWSGVYKSTMVEGGEYLARCRRYIVMNPVRAGIVSQAKDYRWAWQRKGSESEVSAGCLPGEGRRVPQLSEGKIYGSEEFVK